MKTAAEAQHTPTPWEIVPFHYVGQRYSGWYCAIRLNAKGRKETLGKFASREDTQKAIAKAEGK